MGVGVGGAQLRCSFSVQRGWQAKESQGHDHSIASQINARTAWESAENTTAMLLRPMVSTTSISTEMAEESMDDTLDMSITMAPHFSLGGSFLRASTSDITRSWDSRARIQHTKQARARR
jgi:hypothetical protein